MCSFDAEWMNGEEQGVCRWTMLSVVKHPMYNRLYVHILYLEKNI